MTTLTGTYQLPDGTPAAGHVEIIPSVKKILDADGKVILSGRAKVKLDAAGHFSVGLPATDDPTLNPTGFGYTLVAKMNHTHLHPVSFSLPAEPATVDIYDLDTVDPASFTPDVTYATGTDLADVTDRVAELEAAPAPVTSWSELEGKPTTFKPDVTDPDLSATYEALQLATTHPAATGAVTIDVADGATHTVTLAGNVTLTILGGDEGDVLTIVTAQDATGGRTVTWPGGIAWSDYPATIPTDLSVYNLLRVAGAWVGFIAGEGMSAFDVQDTFNAANGTALSGRSTPRGALTWESPNDYADAGGLASTIQSGKITNTTAAQGSTGAVTLPQQDVLVEMDYDLSDASTPAFGQVRLFVRASSVATATIFYVAKSGAAAVQHPDATIAAGSGHPSVGTLGIRAIGNSFTFYINGAPVNAFTTSSAGSKAGFSAYEVGTSVDNFRVTYL